MAGRRSDMRTAVAVALIVFAAAISLWAAASRHEREAQYRTVSICLDYDEFVTIAAQWPEGPAAYWAAMKAAGATSAAVGELTVGWLEDSGRVRIERSPESAAPAFKIFYEDRSEIGISGFRIHARLGPMAEELPGDLESEGIKVSGLTYEQLRNVNIGPNHFIADAVKAAGLSVVYRLSSFGGFDAEWADAALAPSIEEGSAVIFPEKQVAGFPDRLAQTSEILKGLGVSLGTVEFYSQSGMDELSEAMVPMLVRVHSIKPEELAKGMPIEEAAERFARAARERNMRIMYVNPYLFAGEQTDVPEQNLKYIGLIADRIRDSGFSLGEVAAPSTDEPDARFLLVATALGASAAIYLLVMPFSKALALALGLLSAAALTGASVLLPDSLGSMIVPFAAAVSMACLSAYAWIFAHRRLKRGGLNATFFAWLAASAVSVAGGLMLSSPAADTARMLGSGVFFGVKLAQMAPLAFAFAAFWALVVSGKKGGALVGDAVSLGMQPIRWWQAGAVGIAGAAGLYMILRSGNASASYVTGLEAAVRTALERLLVFRPRSKEVFIGHPFMILAGLLLSDGFKGLSLVAFVAGMVGQVSMVNTFMHLHTPIAATAVRTTLGLAAGLMAGLAAAAAYKLILRALRRRWPRR